MAEQSQEWVELAEAQKEIADLRACAESDKQVSRLFFGSAWEWQQEAWRWMRFALENMPDHPEVRELHAHVADWVKKMRAARGADEDGKRPVGVGA